MAKKQIKIKTSNTNVAVATPTEITHIEVVKQGIADAKSSTELNVPAIHIIELRMMFDKANKALKDAIKVEQDKAKLIKAEIDTMEADIKAKALKVVTTEQKQVVNKTTGEVKQKLTHDLETKLFSFTKGSKTAVIDTKAILDDPEKYAKFVKPVTSYEVDFEALNQANSEELPWIEKVNEDKISFKKKLSTADIELILKGKDE